MRLWLELPAFGALLLGPVFGALFLPAFGHTGRIGAHRAAFGHAGRTRVGLAFGARAADAEVGSGLFGPGIVGLVGIRLAAQHGGFGLYRGLDYGAFFYDGGFGFAGAHAHAGFQPVVIGF